MPVVTVTAPGSDGLGVAQAVADAVADALGLGPGEVLAAFVPSAPTVANGGSSTEAWPIVTVRGGDRGREAMTAARVAAEEAVRSTWDAAGLALGGVWVEWILPQPPR